jgi:HK97 family phage prohead protease
MAKKFNFSGYVTKNDLRCSDGRVIRKDAFKHQDGEKVPLVWQHRKDDPSNVLGHAILENRTDGVYGYCTFNNTESGKNAKELVEHGDISALSIHANQLKQVVNDVLHGMIREVSIVIAGANPGAMIDNRCITHSDGSDVDDLTDAIIYSGEYIDIDDVEHAEAELTVQDVFDTFTDEQKDVVYGLIAEAVDAVVEDGMSQSDEDEGEDSSEDQKEDVNHTEQEAPKEEPNTDKKEDITHNSEGGSEMKKNIFEDRDNEKEGKKEMSLSHADVSTIFANAKKIGSLRDAMLEHAGTYGINNIDYLFPDAIKVRTAPDFIKRDDGWVNAIMSGTSKTPFARIKSMAADLTADEARAKGYVAGNLKTEEVFGLLKRVTTPTTVYKKQKLDSDDVIDITDLDVVAWLKMEMRMMLDEEIARAILVGDGRNPASDDKIVEAHIRPIYKDDDMYNHKITLAANTTTTDMMEQILRARSVYKGSGSPTLYTTSEILTDMLLLKDTTGNRIYKTEAEIAAALRVTKIVEVPVMEGLSREVGIDTLDLLGIIVNIKDYTVGADAGGKLSMFDDFDIDYNQHKYLIEGRMSGALTLPKSAMTIERTQAAG